jgi:hypothetical protein
MADTIDPGVLAAPGTEPGVDTARIHRSGVPLFPPRETVRAPAPSDPVPGAPRRTIPFDPYGRPVEERW